MSLWCSVRTTYSLLIAYNVKEDNTLYYTNHTVHNHTYKSHQYHLNCFKYSKSIPLFSTCVFLNISFFLPPKDIYSSIMPPVQYSNIKMFPFRPFYLICSHCFKVFQLMVVLFPIRTKLNLTKVYEYVYFL